MIVYYLKLFSEGKVVTNLSKKKSYCSLHFFALQANIKIFCEKLSKGTVVYLECATDDVNFIPIFPLCSFNASIDIETQGMNCGLISSNAIDTVLFNITFDMLDTPSDELGHFTLKLIFRFLFKNIAL